MDSKLVVSFVIFSFVFGFISCETCNNPKITATSFITRDSAVVTHTAFVTEFSLKCDSPLPPSYALYAEVDGRTMPAVKIPGGKYQVSWTEESPSGGERRVRLFSEEGYQALKKAMRSEEPIESIPSLSSVIISYSKGFGGPWIKSEVIAAILSVGVSYLAFTNKRKLMAA